MNQKNQKKMDKKKNKPGKRRRSNAGKRHGRAEQEEKPKSAEVMNEKEKQDRLEAASVLSSLMFFPPKSSEENENSESGDKGDLVTPSSSVTQISIQPTTSGNSATSQPTSLVQGGRGSLSASAVAESAANLKNSMILAQLQNQLSLALKSKNVHPVVQLQTQPAFAPNNRASLHSKLANDKPDSQNVPLTVLKQTLTVNKNVAKALRQAVSNNKLKSELPFAESLVRKTSENLTEAVASQSEQEKMDSESLSSGRKTGGTDNNLPLKKRRLIGMNDESVTTSDLTLGSNLDTLASARQIENILQMAKDYPASSADSALSLVTSLTQTKLQEGAGYRPVQFDPRTSLMVLSDLKFALTPDEDGDLPIHIAVVHENIELVKKFIDIMAVSGKTVDRFNKLQQTPLHLAVLVKRPEIVSVLLTAGANPNLLDRHGYTSVHISVNKEQPKCMDTIFKDSKVTVNLNSRDYEGYYPLHTCVELDNIKMMMSLVKRGADIDSQDGKAGRSVLLYAVEYNRVDMVHYLLQQGATPDLQNYASVTPMMTAQAANQDDIVNWLNKALDIGNKYEDSYIPSKKVPVPIARIQPKNFQTSNKDKMGRHSVSGDMPLIYEEYSTGSRSQSVSDAIKKEPLSRQSSVSSPIDLSMRHNTDTPSQPPNELTIRGKPGRRKTKKENKNHKEKQPQKSMLKEKHASVVAALEGSMFSGQTFLRKGNDKTQVTDNKLVTSLDFIKVEAQESEDVEMKSYTENGGITDVENAKSNLSSTTLSDFILNLKPDQTKYLVEKVRQQLNVHKDHISTLSSNELIKYSAETECDSRTDDAKKCQENVPHRMDEDLETDDVKNNMPATEIVFNDKDKCAGKITSLKDSGETELEDNEMDEELSNENEAAGNVTDLQESPMVATSIKSGSRSPEVYASDESDIEDISMDCSEVLSEKNNMHQSEKNNMHQMTRSPSAMLESPKESNLKRSQMSDKVNDNNDLDIEEKPVNEVNMHGKIKNYLKERIVNRTECKLLACDESEKLNKTVELVSQTSQESGSSLSLQGSHGSHGFEVISPPVLNVTQDKDMETFQKLNENDQSEDSMEVDFSPLNQVSNKKESGHDIAIDENESDYVKVNSNLINENGDIESVIENIEEKSKANIDTDEDDGETALVIDEHVETEAVNNQDSNGVSVSYASDVKYLETDQGMKEASGMNDTDGKDSGYSETHREAVENIETESCQSLYENCNGETDKKNKKDCSEKGFYEKTDANSETSTDILVTDQDITYGKTVRNIESHSCILSDDKKPHVKENAQGIKEQDSKVKAVGASGLNQSLSQDELLKKGQSHTLFYRDGDGYKPIKIFIDNSKQSSLVLQKMFQSAQLTNVNRQIGLVSTSDIIKTPSANINISDSRDFMTVNSSGINVSASRTTPVTNGSVTENNIGNINENSLKTAVESSSNMNVETSSSAVSLTDYNQSYQQAYIESLTEKASDEIAVTNKSGSIKHNRKPHTVSPIKSDTPSPVKAQNAKLKISNSTKSFDSKTLVEMIPSGKKVYGVPAKSFNVNIAGKSTSEGTLTRVNPDIRRNVKALLSQRKVGLVRSESDSYIVSNKCVNSNIVTTVPETVKTSITDSRQQL